MPDPYVSARDNNIVAWAPNLLALAGLIIGVFFSLDPLESPRPSISSTHITKPDNPDEIYSRLWEDPFNPLDESVNSRLGSVYGYARYLPEQELLCVMTLPQSPTSEAAEMRIRARYAAVSAILNSGYLETTPGMIKVENVDPMTMYFCPPNSGNNTADANVKKGGEKRAAEGGQNSPMEEKIEVESFERMSLDKPDDPSPRYGMITVLYVPESLIFTDLIGADRFPSRRLKTLFDGYAENFLTLNKTEDNPSSLKIDRVYIGPSSSQSFMTFASDAIQTAGAGGSVTRGDESRAILWLSPWATISQSVVDDHLDEDDKFGAQYTQLYQWEGITSPGSKEDESLLRLLRTSCSDDCLSQALVEELMTRGLGCDNHKKEIVLVTEADSIYGKAFRESFQDELDKKKQPQAKLATHADISTIAVEKYTYLSGIDGRIASSQDNENTRRDLSQTEANTGIFAQISQADPEHPPLGRQQYDRIRELANQLKADRDHIFAVGVVGTDVYDKIVILEALKHLLPEAVFFTTDLDSMLIFKDYRSFTQNLVVASSYGFNLNHPYQGEAPPLRDTYQTAIFHSMQVALNDYGPGLKRELIDSETLFNFSPRGAKYSFAGEPDYQVTPNPQVYEVTRQGAKLLQVVKEKEAPKIDRLVQQPGRGYDHSLILPLECWFIVLMVISLWPYEIRRFGVDNFKIFTLGAGIACAISVISTMILVACFYYCAHHDEQESFGWLDGASLWPTEMIRVGIIVMATRYIEYAFCIIRKQLDRVCFTLDSSAEVNKADPAWRWIGRTWRRAMRMVFVVDRRKIDGKHSCGDESIYSLRLIALLATGFFTVGLIFRQVYGVFVPHRGSVSYYFDITAQLIEGILFSVLVAQCCFLAIWVERVVIRPFRNYCNPDTPPPFRVKSQPVRAAPPSWFASMSDKLTVWLRKVLGRDGAPGMPPHQGAPAQLVPGQHPPATMQVQMIEMVSIVASKVESLVLCPFCLLLFVIISENRLIDGWYIGKSLVAIGISACILLILIASSVRSNFSRMRNRVRRNIANKNLVTEREKGAELPTDTLLSRIDGISEMDSIWNNPIFGGLAIILTGAGGSQLMSMLFR